MVAVVQIETKNRHMSAQELEKWLVLQHDFSVLVMIQMMEQNSVVSDYVVTLRVNIYVCLINQRVTHNASSTNVRPLRKSEAFCFLCNPESVVSYGEIEI